MLLRQWEILTHLPVWPHTITVSALHRKLTDNTFDISERTLQRDLNNLSVTFGITNDEARPPGWCWPKDGHKRVRNLPMLNVEEALTFKLVQDYLTPLLPSALLNHLEPFFELADMRCSTPNNTALTGWPDKIAVVAAAQPLLPPHISDDVQAAVSDALLRGRMLRIEYQNREQTAPEERRVHPLAIVIRGSMIYLVAAAENHEHIRLRAMHRIHRAEAMDEAARVPKGYTLKGYIADGWLGFGQGKQLVLKAIFTNQAAQHLEDTPVSADQSIVDAGEGYKRVTATLADTQQLLWWLLGFGDKVVVLEPLELRETIAAIAQGMRDNYWAGG